MPDMKPVRFPLVVQPKNRLDSIGRDARLVNGFLEQDEQGKVWVYKRPGLEVYSLSGTVVTVFAVSIASWSCNYAATELDNGDVLLITDTPTAGSLSNYRLMRFSSTGVFLSEETLPYYSGIPLVLLDDDFLYFLGYTFDSVLITHLLKVSRNNGSWSNIFTSSTYVNGFSLGKDSTLIVQEGPEATHTDTTYYPQYPVKIISRTDGSIVNSFADAVGTTYSIQQHFSTGNYYSIGLTGSSTNPLNARVVYLDSSDLHSSSTLPVPFSDSIVLKLYGEGTAIVAHSYENVAPAYRRAFSYIDPATQTLTNTAFIPSPWTVDTRYSTAGVFNHTLNLYYFMAHSGTVWGLFSYNYISGLITFIAETPSPLGYTNVSEGSFKLVLSRDKQHIYVNISDGNRESDDADLYSILKVKVL